MHSSVVNLIAQPDIHEERIEKFFGGNVRFEALGARFEQPLALLLFANRSGSNLLAEYLVSSGRFSGFGEILNYDSVENVSTNFDIKSFPEYLISIARDNAQGGRVFGTKCSLKQLLMLLRWNIHSIFSGVKIINIERQDIVSQAVSMSIAVQTNSWSSDISPNADPVYNFDEIERYFEEFSSDIVNRRVLLDVLGFESRTFEYGRVVRDPLNVVAECCALFDMPAPENLSETARLMKQGGELNREFSDRFRRDILQTLLGRSQA